jgi:hypothetical protein
MGNWTREGFIGQMFKTFAKFIAPSGMPAPVLWGDEAVVRERLGHGVSDLTMTRRLGQSAKHPSATFRLTTRSRDSPIILLHR